MVRQSHLAKEKVKLRGVFKTSERTTGGESLRRERRRKRNDPPTLRAQSSFHFPPRSSITIPIFVRRAGNGEQQHSLPVTDDRGKLLRKIENRSFTSLRHSLVTHTHGALHHKQQQKMRLSKAALILTLTLLLLRLRTTNPRQQQSLKATPHRLQGQTGLRLRENHINSENQL